MQFSEIHQVLDPKPMRLEMGYERLPDGVVHAASRVPMAGCTGAMFDWWFHFYPDDERYSWWNPVDHVSSSWTGALDPKTVVGSEHIVVEGVGDTPPLGLTIQFRDPAEFFGAKALAAAKAEGRISSAIVAHIGFGHGDEVPRTEDGTIIGGRMMHLTRDTEWGLVLRSHFFLGQDLPALGKTPEEMETLVDETVGRDLVEHDWSEFTFLSRMLPSLYIAETREEHPAQRIW